jgi:hypothetical protein
MAQWMVTQKDNQFGVDTLAELKSMAKDGRLTSGDMVQPPGAADWLYASEIPELKGLIVEIDGGGSMSDTMRLAVMAGVGLVLLVVIGVGSSLALYAFLQMPSGASEEKIFGKGGMAYSEMLVTAQGAQLRSEPNANAGSVESLDKDEALDLLAKRDTFYKARTKGGQEGWIAIDQVLPMYQLGGKKAVAEYDPLYNPDRYVEVGNAAWTLAEGSMTKTVFRFMMANTSKYDMTDLKLLATVKDGKGNELERVEFPIEGIIPASTPAGPGNTMVGELMAENKKETPRLMTEAAFQEMAKDDPDLQLRWVDGIEVDMKTKDFALATIDIVEIRAVPAPVNP